QQQVPACYHYQVALQDAVLDRASAINRSTKAIIRPERGEGCSRDEDLHGRRWLEELVSINRVDDLVRIWTVELHAPARVVEFGPAQDRLNAAVQRGTPFVRLGLGRFSLRLGGIGSRGRVRSRRANEQGRQNPESVRCHHYLLRRPANYRNLPSRAGSIKAKRGQRSMSADYRGWA